MSAEQPAVGSEVVVVGRILRPHGIRGEVVVETLTDRLRRFAPGATLKVETGRTSYADVRIVSRRGHKGRLLVRFEGCEDRDGAERLRSKILVVERTQVPAAEEGSYYYFELIGCDVVDRSEGGLGRIVDVVEDGGGLLLEVLGSDRRLLVPFVKAFMTSIDTENQRIEVDLPQGLIETCRSTS